MSILRREGVLKERTCNVNQKKLIAAAVCLASLVSVESRGLAYDDVERGLTLQRRGTAQAYFAYHGRPLLSFGGISDFIFYAADDAYDYRLWADWGPNTA